MSSRVVPQLKKKDLKDLTWCGDDDLAACENGQEKIIVNMDCRGRRRETQNKKHLFR